MILWFCLMDLFHGAFKVAVCSEAILIIDLFRLDTVFVFLFVSFSFFKLRKANELSSLLV